MVRGYKGKGGVYRSESLDEQMIFMVMLLVKGIMMLIKGIVVLKKETVVLIKGIVVLTVTVKERLHKIQY